LKNWRLFGKTARQAALELGVNFQSLQNWKKQFKDLPAGRIVSTA
jgi:hypothetical protein